MLPRRKLSWADFRKRYEAEKGPALAPKTLLAFKTAANHLQRVVEPRPARQADAGCPIAFHGEADGKRAWGK